MITCNPRCGAFAALGLAALLSAGLQVSSGAGDEPQPVKSARGGLLVTTEPLALLAQAQVAQPSLSQRRAPFVPRYVYRFGYQGYGYYPYTTPAPVAQPTARQTYMYSIPGMFGPGGMTVGPGHRDWSTGRDSPLAKPWMRASD